MSAFEDFKQFSKVSKQVNDILNYIKSLEFDDKVEFINKFRLEIHKVSPFTNEPVDLVQWVKADNITANDYNPNKVAPPEMQLLEVSIIEDGYTQPIVGWNKENTGEFEVVDGFHRSRVGKESIIVKQRINSYLPIVSINKEKTGKKERIASTIRHNRARGKHQVSAMSEIVIELKNRNWTNKRIARELGMDQDEILRLCQISGLESLFSDKDFNNAWVTKECQDFTEFDESIKEEDLNLVKIPNEKDNTRIFHTYDKWEAVHYGFFDLKHKQYSKTQCENLYAALLSDLDLFSAILEIIIKEWKHSCEHNLTNRSMNRIAWLGQAALAYKFNIPSIYCSGFNILTKEEQHNANLVALKHLNNWLTKNNLETVTLEEALLINRQVELY